MEEIISKKIGQIKFGIISPQVIKKIGTVSVVTPELYDADGYPVEKGLMDPVMGIIDPGLRCKTCGGGLKTCAGHFGYIQLSKPIVHILYIKHIHNLLRTFCKDCGRILLPPEKTKVLHEKIETAKKEGNLTALKMLTKSAVTQARKVKTCPFCKSANEEIKLEKPSALMEGEHRLWPTEIRERLEKIPDEDLEILGHDAKEARPDWMILTLLLVPPIPMRPSITLESGERSEDDLTHKLSDIVRVNQRLLENINAGAPEIIIEDLWDLLQYHITTFYNNSISQVPPARHKSNRPLKTLADRLKGKDGRFRYNLAGKRVNFCARSVISPDSYMRIDELGVPMAVAKELTIPERVTEWNLKKMKQYIKRGEDYPGANYIYTDEGKRKKITNETKEQILEEIAPGWVIERHIRDGDIALFNRQPSLHRMSMMAHHIRLVPGKTFRVHPAVLIPYAGDFDGDEMNFHIPQTEEARSEAQNLLILKNNIITPRYGLNIVGETADVIYGLYKLTKDLKLNKKEAYDILSGAKIDDPLPAPADKNAELWDGKQIFSMLLPKELTFSDGKIEIKKGQLVSGTITSKQIGPEGGTLVTYIHEEYGKDVTADFLNNLNLMGLAVTDYHPYTLSFFSLDLSEKARKKIKDFITEGEKNVDKILNSYAKGKIEALPGKSVRETTEAMILSELNNARNRVGKVVETDAKSNNALVELARSGTKGKILNLALMAGSAGQQALRGDRINFGYEDRTLPHFKRRVLGPKAHGFVRSNYIKGLDPIELFYNAIVGRDSLVDTGMRTPKSGYMQRRLINALQDLKVNYDGTVRDSGRRIVQFVFGGDGVDVSKSSHGGVKVGK